MQTKDKDVLAKRNILNDNTVKHNALNYNILNRNLYKEWTLMDVLFLFAVFLLGALIRLSMFRFQSTDYVVYLKVWVDTMKELGGFASLQYRLNNYTTPYTLFLTIISYIPYSSNYLIKLFSCCFDVLLALLAGRVTYQWGTKQKGLSRKNKSILACTIVFILPTVTLNSAAWAQCDVIYSFFMLLFLYYMLQEKSFWAMLYFSIAFSLKLQTIIVIPILVLALLIGKIKWRHLLEIPVVYFISMIPALLAGRPFLELLLVYAGQAASYPALTMNYPNIYYLIGAEAPEAFGTAGLLLAVAVVGIILYLTLQILFEKTAVIGEKQDPQGLQPKPVMTDTQLIAFTLLTGAVMLYLLPHMHERYGYFLDILIILYVFRKPRNWYMAVLWSFVTLMSYVPFLLDAAPPIDFRIQAIVQLITIILIAIDYKKELSTC